MNEKLSVNQTEFISKFLSKDENNKHILIASPGTGKTIAILKIIEKILKKGNIKPLLLLGIHKALVTLFYERIRMFTNNITILEKKSFLEMDDFFNNEKTFWKNGWIYISTTSLLKDERFIQRIKGQSWELIVFDEANIENIKYIEKRNIESKHVLYTVGTSEKLDLELTKNYSITEWKISDYMTEIHSLNKVITYIIKFSRTQEEKEYLQIISEFLKKP